MKDHLSPLEFITMYRKVILLAGGLVLLSAMSLEAQDAVLTQIYGTGVHAYFSNDFAEAHKQFCSAIDAITSAG